ncbi:MAG: DUF4058 family protein [Gemmataceae bacterium]|nr:DUF4058 family protein [Gemmataceae bacterium]
MPVHDWTRVGAGTFHHFHNAWTTHLSEALNSGLLPRGYYALSEQHVGLAIPDILTLHANEGELTPDRDGGVALLAAPPKVGRKLVATEAGMARARRRTLTIRHSSNHRVVAMIEIVSPANKDRQQSVDDFAGKAIAAIDRGIHVLMLDLLPPGFFDPMGMHGAIWGSFGDVDEPPKDQPLALASYDALVGLPQADLERLHVGDVLPEMPLYLVGDNYINTPLESTYAAAFRGMPAYWRNVLEKDAAIP